MIAYVFLCSCYSYQYKANKLSIEHINSTIDSWVIDDPGLIKFLELNGIDNKTDLAFSFDKLFLIGLYYDPELRVAYHHWKKLRVELENINYRPNPELSIPFEYHSDTSDGKSPWTIGSVFNFIYERKSKREARYSAAQIRLFNQELHITDLAYQKYDVFKEAYHRYLVISSIIELLNQKTVLQQSLIDKLTTAATLGAISNFEISTLNLDLQRSQFELGLQQNNLKKVINDMYVMTHLNQNEYDKINIKPKNIEDYFQQSYKNSKYINEDIVALKKFILNKHHKLALALNSYALSEAELKLEIEKQYPDIILSPGFIFDQSDNIWALGASWVLPVFKNSRQNFRILQKIEDRKISQAEVLLLQKTLLDELYKTHSAIKYDNGMLLVGKEILKTIQKKKQQLERQVELGGENTETIIRNSIEYNNAMLTQLNIYKEAMESLHEFQHLTEISINQNKLSKVIEDWLQILGKEKS